MTMPYTHIDGVYVKITAADELKLVLSRSVAERPAGRYNRSGENALYLTVNEESARVALQKYKSSLPRKRLLVEYRVSPCRVIDLRSPAADRLKLLTVGDWKSQLANGIDADSWRVSDELRVSNEIGLIDQSRKRPECWHLVLFRWNEPDAPNVEMVGKPRAIVL